MDTKEAKSPSMSIRVRMGLYDTLFAMACQGRTSISAVIRQILEDAIEDGWSVASSLAKREKKAKGK